MCARYYSGPRYFQNTGTKILILWYLSTLLFLWYSDLYEICMDNVLKMYICTKCINDTSVPALLPKKGIDQSAHIWLYLCPTSHVSNYIPNDNPLEVIICYMSLRYCNSYLLQKLNASFQVNSSIIEECEHWRTNELWERFCQCLGIYATNHNLQLIKNTWWPDTVTEVINVWRLWEPKQEI